MAAQKLLTPEKERDLTRSLKAKLPDLEDEFGSRRLVLSAYKGLAREIRKLSKEIAQTENELRVLRGASEESKKLDSLVEQPVAMFLEICRERGIISREAPTDESKEMINRIYDLILREDYLGIKNSSADVNIFACALEKFNYEFSDSKSKNLSAYGGYWVKPINGRVLTITDNQFSEISHYIKQLILDFDYKSIHVPSSTSIAIASKQEILARETSLINQERVEEAQATKSKTRLPIMITDSVGTLFGAVGVVLTAAQSITVGLTTMGAGLAYSIVNRRLRNPKPEKVKPKDAEELVAIRLEQKLKELKAKLTELKQNRKELIPALAAIAEEIERE